MTTQTSASEIIVSKVRPADLQAKLYREIGISAVAAALEWSARRPQKPAQARTVEIPAFLRNDEA
jgi:hypothetical protein